MKNENDNFTVSFFPFLLVVAVAVVDILVLDVVPIVVDRVVSAPLALVVFVLLPAVVVFVASIVSVLPSDSM